MKFNDQRDKTHISKNIYDLIKESNKLEHIGELKRLLVNDMFNTLQKAVSTEMIKNMSDKLKAFMETNNFSVSCIQYLETFVFNED